jgi:hypothetical protein
MPKIRWISLIIFAALVNGCVPSIDSGADGGSVIIVGPAGGNFQRDGAVIAIPANAVSTDTAITVTVDDDGPEIPGRQRISYVYRFSPSSLSFKVPVQIIVPWVDTKLPVGAQSSTFQLHRNLVNETPVTLLAPLINNDYKIITASVESLGKFWATAPEAPAISEIQVEPKIVSLRVSEEIDLKAKVLDTTGAERTEATVTWKVIPERVASISASGHLTTLSPGNATIVVKADAAEARVPLYVLGDATGPTTFIHENPFPTGNDLYGGALSGAFAFFVGSNGTVLTREPGDVWQRRFSATGITLKSIAGTVSGAAAAAGSAGTAGVVLEAATASASPVVVTIPDFEPRALWFDGTYGMAVGNGNDVAIRKGGTWGTAYSPSFETLLALTGDGAGGFTTVGNRGSLYRYDPGTLAWDSLFQSQLSVLLTGAVVLPTVSPEVWAIGNGKLWHHAAGAWTSINLPSAPAVTALTAVGLINGKVIVAGQDGRVGVLFTYDPGAAGDPWISQRLHAPQLIRGIFGTGSVGYAVGDVGAVWRYDGASGFTEVSHGFYGQIADVSVLGASVVAAVNECTNDACTARVGKVMARVSPGLWTELGAPAPFTAPLTAVLIAEPDRIYASASGLLYKFNGIAWSSVPVTGSLGVPILDLQNCGSAIRAVGESGLSYRGTATTFSNQSQLGTSDLYSVACTSDEHLWSAGDFALYDNRQVRTTKGVNPAPWRAVWSPAPGEAFAFGDARYGVYWDTERFQVIETPGGVYPDVVSGLWGSSIDNLYAVGYSVVPFATSFALRFDGAQWKRIDSGVQRKITSIAGSSNTEIWIGTEAGGLLRGYTP